MFNQANLSHPTMQAKIYGALQRARVNSLKDGMTGIGYVRNRHGKVIMLIRHYRHDDGLMGGFEFRAAKQGNINELVKQSMRAYHG